LQAVTDPVAVKALSSVSRARLLARRLLPFRAFQAAARNSLDVWRPRQHAAWPGQVLAGGCHSSWSMRALVPEQAAESAPA
jgi:hypothetical protein